MVQAIDLTGQRFGNLVAAERIGNYRAGQARWLLRCDCGGESKAHTGELRAGKRKSCANPVHRQKHGMHKSRLYRVWGSMLARCYRPSHPRFERYGGRGIGVCDEWRAFELFANWAIGHGYRDDLQIDRIDNSKGYSPENCHFVTAAQNMANRDCSSDAVRAAHGLRPHAYRDDPKCRVFRTPAP